MDEIERISEIRDQVSKLHGNDNKELYIPSLYPTVFTTQEIRNVYEMMEKTIVETVLKLNPERYKMWEKCVVDTHIKRQKYAIKNLIDDIYYSWADNEDEKHNEIYNKCKEIVGDNDELKQYFQECYTDELLHILDRHRLKNLVETKELTDMELIEKIANLLSSPYNDGGGLEILKWYLQYNPDIYCLNIEDYVNRQVQNISVRDYIIEYIDKYYKTGAKKLHLSQISIMLILKYIWIKDDRKTYIPLIQRLLSECHREKDDLGNDTFLTEWLKKYEKYERYKNFEEINLDELMNILKQKEIVSEVD